MKSDAQIAESARRRQQKQNEYINRNFDRVSVVMPRGYKGIIQGTGESINAFIVGAITAELTRRGLLYAAPPAEDLHDTPPASEDVNTCPF